MEIPKALDRSDRGKAIVKPGRSTVAGDKVAGEDGAEIGAVLTVLKLIGFRTIQCRTVVL